MGESVPKGGPEAVTPLEATTIRNEPATTGLSAANPAEKKVAAPPVAAPEPAPAISQSLPFAQSTQKMGIAIGLVAAVLLASGGAWVWYASLHRSSPSMASTQPTSQQVAATTTEQTPKPSPGTIQESPSNTSRPQPEAKTTPMPHTPSVATPHDSGQFRKVTIPQPGIETPALTSPSALEPVHAGTLHYQGPAVPFGGSVVFDHLPKDRLKFSFDSTAWRLTIRPNTDGTKKVILTSQKQGFQSNCDLGWEVVE